MEGLAFEIHISSNRLCGGGSEEVLRLLKHHDGEAMFERCSGSLAMWTPVISIGVRPDEATRRSATQDT